MHNIIRRTKNIPKVTTIASKEFQVLADTFAQDYKQMLYDVKGTIAFRQDKLQIAYDSWSKSAFDYFSLSFVAFFFRFFCNSKFMFRQVKNFFYNCTLTVSVILQRFPTTKAF